MSLLTCRFASVSQSARMDWSSFTKGYFLNRETLVGVLLLIDASIPPTKIDLDCANWLGRNNVRQRILQLMMLLHADCELKV
jgi:GTP-binding protein EngB required for normal cell division